MKTTLELPDALIMEVKLRAVLEHRKLKDTMADLLRRGLDSCAADAKPFDTVLVGFDERSGFPIIRRSRPDGAPDNTNIQGNNDRQTRPRSDSSVLSEPGEGFLNGSLVSAEDDEAQFEEAVIAIDERTGFPIIIGGRRAAPGHEITPERIFEILHGQEVEWYATPR